MKISVALATYNEEKNLSNCLDSVYRWVDEIVVVDGSSTDKTQEIAKKYKAKVIITDNPPIFHINKQKAIEECTGDWILQLDADEVVSGELKKEIIKVINQQSIDGFWIPRQNYFLGKWLKKGGAYPDYVLRLFKKGTGRLPCRSVHEQIEVEGRMGYLTNDLVHRPYPTFLQYLRKAKVYTSLSAQELAERKISINLFTIIRYMIKMPFQTFINIYFRHTGFLDGIPGFVWAFFSALHHPIAFIKYWGRNNVTMKPASPADRQFNNKINIKVALIKPPIAGHKYRGTGTYTSQLFAALKKIEKIDITAVNINDDVKSYDLIHYPYFDPFFLTLPIFKQKPTVVTVHDLIPMKFPDKFPTGFKGKIKWLIQKASLKSCPGIITDSNASKDDIIRFTGINQDKIKVIYLGVGEQFKVIDSGKQLTEVKNRLKLPEEFILHVGDVNYNKNIQGLIRAFKIIANKYPSLSLLLIGKGFVTTSVQLSEITQLKQSLKLSDKVHIISNVTSSDMAGIYNQAKIYLQPSFAEGFGLPVLEAMVCGCPVVASNCSSLPEITRDACIAIDPNDTQGIAQGCINILVNEKRRNSIIQKGLIRAKLFSWDKCAQETTIVYKNILS